MGYGRLDVYYPDGKVESYTLDKPSVSIGRASTNTIVLDTDTISRNHLSITQQNGVVSLTDLDSENGTYADGVRLANNAPYLLKDTEEFQIGYLRLIYHPMDETVTAPMTAAEETQRIERDLADFSLAVDHMEISVWPASSSSVEVAIGNHADTTRLFFVTISGLPNDWMRLNRPTLEIHGKNTSHALVNIKPPRYPDIKPQMYRLTIEVVSADDADKVLRTEILVYVRGFSGFGMALSSKQIELEDPLIVYMQNQGSEDLTLVVSGRDKQNALTYGLVIPRVTLGAGERAQIPVRVMPRQRALTGKPVVYGFTMIVQAQNASHFIGAISGKLLVEPRLPSWAVNSVVGVGVGVLLLLLFALFGIFSPRTPVINNLVANAPRLAQGDPLLIEWEAQDVNGIKISVNDTLVQTLEGNARRATIPTNDLNGDLSVLVLGENGNTVASQTVSVFVYRPINVLSLMATPNTLVRHVITPLDITWETEGATLLRLEGLETFTNQELPTITQDTGTISVIGYARDALTLTLYLEDEVGNQRQETLDITVIDPLCNVIRDVPLYEGTDTRYQQVSAVPQNTPLVVLARNPDTTWLQVLLAGGATAWGEREAFECTPNFALEDLLIEANIPPLPTVAPSPTATLTATLAPTIAPTVVPTATLAP